MAEYIHQYDSLTALYSAVHLKPSAANRKHPIAKYFRDDYRDPRNRELGGHAWYGIDTDKPSEAINAILKGYKPGLETIQRAAAQLEPFPIKSVKRTRARGAQGDDLDIMRVYDGQLDKAWSTTKALSGSAQYGKEIKIACDVGGTHYTNSDALKWRGAFAAILADAYAQAGYRVEVLAYAYNRNMIDGEYGGGTALQTTVKVCDSADPFDLEKLANTICFPGFLRTLIFEDFLTVPLRIRDGLGHSGTGVVPSILKDAIIVKDMMSLADVRRAQAKFMDALENN